MASADLGLIWKEELRLVPRSRNLLVDEWAVSGRVGRHDGLREQRIGAKFVVRRK